MKKIIISIVAFVLWGLVGKAQEIGSFTDSCDGHVYKTVKIGNQWWMAENLAYKPNSGNFWAYDNAPNNVAKYGFLYDYETAKKICPSGWHLPSIEDWIILVDYLGGQNIAGGKIKSKTDWEYFANTSNTNESGFNALPSGCFIIYDTVDKRSNGLGSYANFWTSKSIDSEYALKVYLAFFDAKINSTNERRTEGLSVRCIKD